MSPLLGRGRQHGVRGLAVSSHVVPPAAVRTAAPPSGWGGLVLGFAEDGRPVPVRLFRTEPTRAVMSSLDVVRVAAMRALAVGADLRVGTSRPSAWAAVARLGVEGSHQVSVVNGPVRTSRPGTVHVPVLVVRDAVGEGRRDGATSPFGDTGQIPVVRMPGAGLPGAWTARVTVVREPARPASASLLAAADLAVLGRLEAPEAETVSAALAAPHATARMLTTLPQGWMLLVPKGGQPLAVEMRPSAVERQMLSLGAGPVG